MFWSRSRAQVEPLPALVAVSAFVAALGLYAVAFHDVPLGTERDVETQALSSVVEDSSTAGVLDPTAVMADAPRGHEMAVVVRADGSEWQTGPSPPTTARTATEQVLVRTASGEQVGRIRVWVWR
ncbi:DUF7285 family protein [Halanaeroarchaeum sulfurireducens]|uniref:Uncharacterized protein n=1 Tax=Halanaeroarchaeum sulfurireducens TaxID=1604004 RepID=A0A0N9N420_9EURY|nr:hypothetical protein [Halanaeroarchaeum sulfurireducens]ALG81494.1 hypothetical protein HLASA_0593 [Halanaeroarchaeum sulfurireducens]